MVELRDGMRGRREGARLLGLLVVGLLLFGPGTLSGAGQKKGGRRGDVPAVRKGQRPAAAAHPPARDAAPPRAKKPSHEASPPVVEERPHPHPRARPEVRRSEGPRKRPDVRIIETPGHGRHVRDVPPPALLQEGPPPASSRPAGAGTEDRVRGALDRFRRDWVRGDSRSLSEMLSKRGRIRISIESSGIHDSFGRGQARYVLREYFASTRNRQLAFSRLRVSASDGESAYGVGKMKIRDRETGKVREHTVFVSMAPEGDGWAIREIRITD